MDPINDILTRGVANIIPSKEELEKVLRSNRKINIYLGIDPTSPNIHLGHAVALRRLQKLSDLGHHVTFLIGDFTTLVGDTSDKDSERPILTREQIETNWQTYQKQAAKIIDFSKVKVVRNSQWLEKLTFSELISLFQKFTLNDFISRELIKKRLEAGSSIRLDETIYPLMQGYDSWYLDTDLQLGGTDQTFNMQAGRHLQKVLRNKESFVLTGVFLEGTDGRKMSKSWGNAIWLTDSPDDMYGKVMSLKDELVSQYFLLGTNLPIQDIPTSGHPMELKKRLAWQIVSELHDSSLADIAQKKFESTFQQGQTPTDISEMTITSTNIIDVLVETRLAGSKSAARRLLTQGGVQINGTKISDVSFDIDTDTLIQVGPRKFVKISPSQHAPNN